MSGCVLTFTKLYCILGKQFKELVFDQTPVFLFCEVAAEDGSVNQRTNYNSELSVNPSFPWQENFCVRQS